MLNIEVDVSLKGIDIEKFNIDCSGLILEDAQKFEFEIEIINSYNEENKLVLITCRINVLINKKILSNIELGLLFKFNSFDELKPKDKYVLPTKIQDELNKVVISTTRGALYSHLKGTALHNAILPLLSI